MKSNIVLIVCLLAALFCGCAIQNIAGAYQEAQPVTYSAVKQPEIKQETVTTEPMATPKTDNVQTTVSAVVSSAFASAQATPETQITTSAKSKPGFVPELPLEEKDVRSEAFTIVNAAETTEPLKTYHVVIGSFKKQANAESLQAKMRPQYAPVIVRNTQGMYRVLLVSFDDFASAKRKCENVQSQFHDVWILVQQQ